MKEERTVNTPMFRSYYQIGGIICVTFLISGCVMTEKYEAEKARALNFQRLLVQEEKRSVEFSENANRSKKEVSEFESRNRELTAQVQAIREQLSRVQEEAEAIKETAFLERTTKAESRSPDSGKRKGRVTKSISGNGDSAKLSVTERGRPGESNETSDPAATLLEAPAVHIVKLGDTLYQISRQYTVSVDKIKKWNQLTDDNIQVDMKLIVGR